MSVKPLVLLVAVALAAFGGVAVKAQTESRDKGFAVTEYFYNAPSSVASNLSRIDRLDMVDYYNIGATAKTVNKFGKNVSIGSISNEMITWTDGDSISTSLALLPLKTSKSTWSVKTNMDTVLMVVRTIKEPFADSAISFYWRDWRPMELKPYTLPTVKDWFTDTGKDYLNDLDKAVPFLLVKAEYEPTDKTLTLTNVTAEYYAQGDVPKSLAKLKGELKFQWDSRGIWTQR